MDPIPVALWFALASLLLQGCYDLLYQLAHRRSLHEPTYMVVQTATVFSTLGLLSGAGIGFTLTWPMVALGMVSGMLGIVTGFSVLYAMGRGPGSVTAASRRLSFVVTGLLAVAFLGERLTVEKLAAMVLAAFALLMVAVGRDALSRPHPAIYVALVSGGLMAFIHKVAAGAGISASAFLMVQSGTAHVSSHVLCLRRGGYRFSANTVRFALSTGSLIALAMLCGMYALRAGEAVVIAPVLQLGFLVSAPLSFWIMREPVTRPKLWGIGLGAAAICLFALEL